MSTFLALLLYLSVHAPSAEPEKARAPLVLAFAGPAILDSADPQALYVVLPAPDTLSGAVLTCGSERIELQAPIWGHPDGLCWAFMIPAGPSAPGPCGILVDGDKGRRYQAPERLEFGPLESVPWAEAPVTELLLGSERRLELKLQGFSGRLDFRLFSLERPGKKLEWSARLSKKPGAERVISLVLPDRPPVSGDYLLVIEETDGPGLVLPQIIHVARQGPEQ